MPSQRVLAALARASEVPPAYLRSPLGVELDAVELRKNAGASKHDRMRVQREVLRRVEVCLLVEEALELDSRSGRDPAPRQAASAP